MFPQLTDKPQGLNLRHKAKNFGDGLDCQEDRSPNVRDL